jgi:hypothetical protein
MFEDHEEGGKKDIVPSTEIQAPRQLPPVDESPATAEEDDSLNLLDRKSSHRSAHSSSRYMTD